MGRKKAAALKTRELWMLGLLVEGPLHGYALMSRLEEESGGRVRVSPATLYRTLDGLAARGLIEPAEAPAKATTARHPWRLTARGRSVVRAELESLSGLVDRVRDALGGAAG